MRVPIKKKYVLRNGEEVRTSHSLTMERRRSEREQSGGLLSLWEGNT